MKTLLLVEDHKETAGAIIDYLKSFFPAWQIKNVVSGKEAIESTTTNCSDVMIVDIALVDQVDGMQVVRAVAKLNKKPRIIIVTALGNKAFGPKPGRPWLDQLEDHERALVEAFFEKPFQWIDFLTAIAKAGNEPPPASLARLKEF
jgi:CheY-like chemotaxis protein